MIRSA